MKIILVKIFFYIASVNCITNQHNDARLVQSGRRAIVGFLQFYQDMIAKKPYNKMQNVYSPKTPFFCDAKTGPGKRNKNRPTSINNLRPGDIDIVMAMGDSLTAGHGAAATNLLDIAIENRGMSWSIGGEKDWRTYITLPNLLKEFNPKLYGYSLGNAITIQKASKFNVAEGASESRDMLYQAKVLRQRLIHDPKVDFKNHWKLLTVFFGAIDFCFNLCYERQYALEMHKLDMIKFLRYVRDNIPRVFVNIVSAPDILNWATVKKPDDCEAFHVIECDCFKRKNESFVNRTVQLSHVWQKIDDEIANWNEFHTDEFTVVIQPFSKHYRVPTLKNGDLDLQYYSTDCFHFSQKFHKIGAIAVWNNLFEPIGNKSDYMDVNVKLFCPTNERYLFRTKMNSKLLQ